MTKIVTMHQPNYIPWIGFFSKVSRADTLILYDTAGYTNGGIIHRNKIRTDRGWCYLTVPVARRFFESLICEVEMPETRRWKLDHWKTMCQYYGRSKYFDEHRVFFESVYQSDFDYLWRFNEKIIRYLLDCFHIRAEVLCASEIGMDNSLKGTAAIVDCMKRAGAGCYISGPSGKNYLDVQQFADASIEVEYFKFSHPVYRQCYPGFEAGMSAIDLLFTHGPAAREIIELGNERVPVLVPV